MNTPKSAADASASPSALLPIFPLQTVLFPDGVLPLRIFEARYMDMVTRCLREDSVFGVNLIAGGLEVGLPAIPHSIGVSARITACDMAQPGVLQVMTRGGRRYRIHRTETGENGLLLGEVEWLPELVEHPLDGEYSTLVALLAAIIEDVGPTYFPAPHRLDEAGWVGMRLASVLPLELSTRQSLLELDDPLLRLDALRDYLAAQGLGAA